MRLEATWMVLVAKKWIDDSRWSHLKHPQHWRYSQHTKPCSAKYSKRHLHQTLAAGVPLFGTVVDAAVRAGKTSAVAARTDFGGTNENRLAPLKAGYNWIVLDIESFVADMGWPAIDSFDYIPQAKRMLRLIELFNLKTSTWRILLNKFNSSSDLWIPLSGLVFF